MSPIITTGSFSLITFDSLSSDIVMNDDQNLLTENVSDILYQLDQLGSPNRTLVNEMLADQR